MYWEVVKQGQILLSLHVDHEFLDWLRPRVTDSEVAQLDPFRNVTLDRQTQTRWLLALRKAHDALLGELRTFVETKTHGLPKQPGPRETIIRQLTQQRMAEHAWAKLIGDLTAALELSLESNASMRVSGD